VASSSPKLPPYAVKSQTPRPARSAAATPTPPGAGVAGPGAGLRGRCGDLDAGGAREQRPASRPSRQRSHGRQPVHGGVLSHRPAAALRRLRDQPRPHPRRRRQARPRRARPRRQGRRPRAARRRHGGHLHRAAPDARADRRDHDPGGRRLRRACRCCPART
jgi:hypothetical protein